jgi:hypothetical protein
LIPEPSNYLGGIQSTVDIIMDLLLFLIVKIKEDNNYIYTINYEKSLDYQKM